MQVIKIISAALVFFIFVSCSSKEDAIIVKKKPQSLPEKKFEDNKKITYQQHVVRKGDTIASVAKMYDASIADIMLDNHLNSNENVLIGKILKIRVKNNVSNLEINKNENFEKKYEELQKRPSVSLPKSNGKIFTSEVNYSRIPAGEGYSKSIGGSVIANYNTNRGGRPLMGVELRSNSNQVVKAVHNGIVSFISDDFSGYGRCIGISNSRNELVFIYGLGVFKVKVGDIVTRGMPIGNIDNGKVLGIKILRKGIFQDPSKIISGL